MKQKFQYYWNEAIAPILFSLLFVLEQTLTGVYIVFAAFPITLSKFPASMRHQKIVDHPEVILSWIFLASMSYLVVLIILFVANWCLMKATSDGLKGHSIIAKTLKMSQTILTISTLVTAAIASTYGLFGTYSEITEFRLFTGSLLLVLAIETAVYTLINKGMDLAADHGTSSIDKIKSVKIEDMKTLVVVLTKAVDPVQITSHIKLSRGTVSTVSTVKKAPTALTITTKEVIDLKRPLVVTVPGFGSLVASAGAVVRTKAFDRLFAFNGQLGALYTNTETTFHLWAPTAMKVNLVFYDGDKIKSSVKSVITMDPGPKGTWSTRLKGDHKGTVYTYHLVFSDGSTSDTADPYATATIVNGGRSVVLAPQDMIPAHWGDRMAPFPRPTDAVISEIQIRDFSIAPNSGIQSKGKYLGVIETGTKTTKGTVSGLDHLKAMGVTHVQIMPMYDFASMDESKPDTPQYNWGYDPENYNVPEGSFSSDATNPQTRILEAKEMIQGLHNNGLRVIMDVVYNHVYDPGKQAFQQTVPGYYFRYDENGKLANGTGVGNDVASDRAMARKYIVDSVTYWAKNYHIDGFRFDLMGVLDTETMKEVRAALDQIDPSIITLGEGWDLNTPLAADRKANQKNANRLPAVAFFNDSMRDAIKGSVFEAADPGFVNGKTGVESLLAKNILGGQDLTADLGTTYVAPTQLIQYAEAHDNLTLYDKLVKTNPDDTDAVRAKRDMLANSIVLLSQGVPFMQNGQEFLRTKDGDENSYKSPDAINQIDWDRAATYAPAVNYMKGLIALRKATPALHYTSYTDIKANTKLLQAQDRVVAYQAVAGDKTTTIIFNANEKDTPVKLANGTYAILVKDDQVDTRGSKSLTVSNGEVNVPALSTLVLQQTATSDGTRRLWQQRRLRQWIQIPAIRRRL